ncbi:MAG: type II secretion system GspH family protein [Bdellovibrionaceae bacterium]|nr:type II secretion system GspH family protein [Pseudobdellovibrionaceae bacterium]
MRSKRTKNLGFTLLEILVVLAIIAAAIVVGATRFQRKENSLKAVTRQMSTAVREVRNLSRVKRSAYRIVFDMSKEPHAWWIETSSQVKPIDPETLTQDSETEEDKPSLWQVDNTMIKEPKTLPSGIFFGMIESMHLGSPITTGKAYLHFFPSGFVEASAIQITDRKNTTWTIFVNPLTGQTDIVPEGKSLKDIRQ